ncbi:two-partner secretion domain-containing protein [Yersinia proxima]|uniref:two-partner secretion domain-containing protein n=1 Tax=Yersinia proxima TaxID=2890316 RepID=UPI001D0F71D6|nr:hemagglutinin repeat-containing protein [Yersinia proxima]
MMSKYKTAPHKSQSSILERLTPENLHKKLCPIYLAMATSLPCLAYANIIPDHTGNTPNMNQSANDTPVVNIVNPNDNGISHNKFDEFNVGPDGLIFNNSMQDGVSQIGGFVIKNGQLQQEASAIISEVTGAKGSKLNGTMEVFGKSADLIIANENGITVNGVSTINANNLTLSTGRVAYGSDGNIQLKVDKGMIGIEGQGLSTEGLTHFDMVSRTVKLDGEISGKADINVITGLNNYDTKTRKHQVHSQSSSNTPKVSIDGGSLGSMYGGRIQLISTESGVGVHHKGSIVGNQGIEISANGDLVLTGIKSQNGDVNLSGNNIDIAMNDATGYGGIVSSNDIVIRALSQLRLNADAIAEKGNIRINADSLLQNASRIIAMSSNNSPIDVTSIYIDVKGEYNISGNLFALDAAGNKIDNATITLVNGEYVVSVNGSIVSAASISSDASISSQSGNVTVKSNSLLNSNAGINTKNGSLNFYINDTFENNGMISASGSLDIVSSHFGNSGDMFSSQVVNIDIGSLINKGKLQAEKNITIKTNEFDNSGKIISSESSLNLAVNGSVAKNSGLLSGNETSITLSGDDSLLDNSGDINADNNLTISSDSIYNSGSILAKKDAVLNITKELNNQNNAEIIAGNTLNINSKGSKKVNINNNNSLIQGDSIVSDNLNKVTNTNGGMIVADSSLKLSNVNELINAGDNSLIQAADLTLDAVKKINNSENAMMLTSDNLVISNADELVNTNASMLSSGNIKLSSIGKITNTNGLINADDSIYIDNVDVLLNSGTGTTQSSGSGIVANNIDIRSVGLLENTGGSYISSLGDLLNLEQIKHIINDASSMLTSDNNLNITGSMLIKNHGVLYSGNSLSITDIDRLENTGDGSSNVGIINAGKIMIVNVGEIVNSLLAIINSDSYLSFDKINTLINNNSIIQSVNTLTLNAIHVINNNTNESKESAVIFSSEGIEINATTIENKNGAALASDGDISLVAKTINNNSSVISANNMSLTASEFNNSNGQVDTISDLLIKLTNYFNNNSGSIFSGNKLSLGLSGNAGNYTYNESSGDLNAKSHFDLNVTGSIIIDRILETAADLFLSADGNIDNNSSVLSLGDLSLKAKDITNKAGSLLFSKSDINIDARNGSFINENNANVLSMNNMAIHAKNIKNNAGTIRSEGDMALDAQLIENTSNYDNPGWVAGPSEVASSSVDWCAGIFCTTKYYFKLDGGIPTWVGNLQLNSMAEISANGNLYINQKKDISYAGPELKNKGGIIQSRKDMVISGNVYNSPEVNEKSFYEYLTGSLSKPIVLEFSWNSIGGDSGTAQFDSIYNLLDFLLGNGLPSDDFKDSLQKDIVKYNNHAISALKKFSGNNQQLNSVMNRLFGDAWLSQPDSALQQQWASLIKSDNNGLKNLKDYGMPDNKGAIIAGGNLIHNNGVFENGLHGVSGADQKITVEVGDKTIEVTQNPYEVNIGLKSIAEITKGLSTTKTYTELAQIKGLFIVSQGWKDIDLDVSVKDQSSNAIYPFYETRTEFIDQSLFFGTDYFFDQIGYAPDKPVIVIGDNYFISEIIRRQINESVGSFFSVRDGVDGEDLVEKLMSNAATVNGVEGFTVGEGLTDDQIAALDKDIVWFVTEYVDGTPVLAPKIYFATTTIDQLSSGLYDGSATVHAGGNIDIDADSFSNVNGQISAGGNISIKSEGDINNSSIGMNGGISSGGDLSLVSTDGSINNSGAGLHAGNDLTLQAENGSVELTASQGSNDSGQQKYHIYDDAITAGGNIDMTAKDITVNAVDISAANDISLTSTEGDVTFNNLYEVDGSYDYKHTDTGFLSHETTTTVSSSATSVDSSVNAGGKFTIDSAKDIVLKGGEYNAQSGELKAAGDLDVQTSQDYTYSETTVDRQEVIFGANANGVGQSAEYSVSSLDGDSSHVGSGEHDNLGSNISNAGGKRPGRAPTTSTAGFTAGVETTTKKDTEQTTSNKNASLNFTDSIALEAGGVVDIGGGDFTTEGGLSIKADEVKSTKYEDEVKTTSEETTTFIGMKGEGHSSIADAVDKELNLAAKGNESKNVDAGLTAAEVAGSLSNIAFNDLLGGSVTIGADTTTSSSSSTAKSENITNITAGNVSIDSNKDTTLKGVDLTADSVKINTGGDLNILAAESSVEGQSKTDSHSAGLSMGASVAPQGSGVGASIDYHGSTSSSTESSKTFTNSTLNSGDIEVNTGGNMTLAGGNIQSDTANLNIAGDLNIETVQDTVNNQADSKEWGGSIGVAVSSNGGLIPTVAVNYGQGGEHHDSQLTGAQSGINTSGEVNITTGGDLNLTGGHIVSDNKTGNIDVTGNINATELSDSIDQQGSYSGGGGGMSTTGIPTVNGYHNTVEKIEYQEDQKATIDVGSVSGNIQGQLNTNSDEMSQVNKDEVTASNNISFTVGGWKGKGKQGADSATSKPSQSDSSTSNTSTPSRPVQSLTHESVQKPKPQKVEVVEAQKPSGVVTHGTASKPKPQKVEVVEVSKPKPQKVEVVEVSKPKPQKVEVVEVSKPKPQKVEVVEVSKPKPQKVEIVEVPKPVVSKPVTSWPTVQIPTRPVTSVGSSNSGANHRLPSTQATDPGSKLPTSGTGGTVIGSPGSAGAASFTNRPASKGPAVSHNTFIEKTPVGGKGSTPKQERVEEAKKESSGSELRQKTVSYDGKTSMNSGVWIMPEKTITGEHYSQEFSEKAQKYNAYS